MHSIYICRSCSPLGDLEKGVTCRKTIKVTSIQTEKASPILDMPIGIVNAKPSLDLSTCLCPVWFYLPRLDIYCSVSLSECDRPAASPTSLSWDKPLYLTGDFSSAERNFLSGWHIQHFARHSAAALFSPEKLEKIFWLLYFASSPYSFK